ncbi:MAG: hypothetical protein HGA82_00490 [Anaerolineales bacterium]|nr:hypothetical protein [Anaerolineales bacterium]
MNLDIHDAVVMMVILAAAGGVVSVWLGILRIRKGRAIAYYRLRRRQVQGGWRSLALAVLLAGVAILVGLFAEPAAYSIFPPSATPSLTPTITLTPTISLTPTITEIPSITPTPAISHTPTLLPTPFMPDAIAIQFTGAVTPDPAVIFSPLQFSRTISSFLAVDPATVFENPVGKIFATFSYDGMSDGVQWTALWTRDGEPVHYETESWKGGTGGYAYSSWEPLAENWLPGRYQVVLFVGVEWKVIGEFRVTGEPPTATFTVSPTITRTLTKTSYPSATLRPSDTHWPTDTRWPTPTK